MGQGSFFRWRTDIQPVFGHRRASILDFRTGDVYSLNGAAAAVLGALHEGQAPEEFGVPERAFVAELLALGLGQLTGAPRPPEPPSSPGRHPLDFLWIELRSDCNAACAHCYSQSQNPRLYPQDKGMSDAPSLAVAEWMEVLRQAVEAGCRAVQFIGGEALLARELPALLAYAHDLGYDYIEVFTNAIALNDHTATALAAAGARVTVSLHGVTADTHDAVAGLPGSFDRVLTGLARLRRHGVPFRVGGVAVRANQDDILGLPALAASLGATETRLDVVRPIGSGADPALLPDAPDTLALAWQTRPAFTADRRRYEHNRHWNPCWAGKMTITATGDVLPCVMGRDNSVGNVRRTPLADILAGPHLGALWGLTKDEMAVCRDCEYRYVCGDCRPLAATNGDLRGAMPRCTYDPCTGKWGAGPRRQAEPDDAPPESFMPLLERLPRSPKDRPAAGTSASPGLNGGGRLVVLEPVSEPLSHFFCCDPHR